MPEFIEEPRCKSGSRRRGRGTGMSLIEKLERELGSAEDVTTMDHVTHQDKLAAQSLILDFKIAVEGLRVDNLIKLADCDIDEIGVTIH